MLFFKIGIFSKFGKRSPNFHWDEGRISAPEKLRTQKKILGHVLSYSVYVKFPGIGESIYGEESNRFTNTLGETVTIKIQPSAEKTKTLLGRYDLTRFLD